MNSKEIRISALLVLDTIFFLLEAIIGYSVHSLALIADSFHMLNDIISLIIALWAVRMKNSMPADDKYTYGWQRAEILGALINAVFLLALCFTIIIEAIQRFFEPAEITQPKLILVVGIAGLLSNGVGLVLFHEHGHSHSHGGSSHAQVDEHEHEHEHSHGHSLAQEDDEASVGAISNKSRSSSADIVDYMPDNFIQRYSERSPLIKKGTENKKKRSMNMEGVFLHVLGDALGNIGVIATALFIWKTDFWWRYYSDPLVSLFITVIIFSSALPLCKNSSKILLQATPTHVDSNSILSAITNLDSVKSVHDFHIWNLNEDILIASLHLELADISVASDEQFDKHAFLNAVSQVREILHEFGIHSATIQPEFGGKSNPNLYTVYGPTSKLSCVVDDASNCDNSTCIT